MYVYVHFPNRNTPLNSAIVLDVHIMWECERWPKTSCAESQKKKKEMGRKGRGSAMPMIVGSALFDFGAPALRFRCFLL